MDLLYALQQRQAPVPNIGGRLVESFSAIEKDQTLENLTNLMMEKIA